MKPTITLSEHWYRRFRGVERLYGHDALCHLARAHFVVAGIGGVGSWTAEALARSGVGTITLIDLDEVCVTNTNRQLHALNHTVGLSKIELMQERMYCINPEMQVNLVDAFLTRDNITELVTPEHHMVIDAFDLAHTKSALIAYCSARKIGLITVGSAGGKKDPSKVTWNDLARTECDPMFVKIREDLYRRFGFSKDKKRKFRVDAIYSTEAMVYPQPDGTLCARKTTLADGVKLDCTGGIGSACMVTGTFGFLAASRGISRYLMRASR